MFVGEDPPKAAGAAQRSGVECQLVPTPNIVPGSSPQPCAVLPVLVSTKLSGCIALGSGGIAAIIYPKTEFWLPGVPCVICA